MKNLFSVEGKVVLVTGGSRGIGEMIARGYVENGAKVYISSRKAEVCDRVAEELSEYGTCISLPFDLGGMDDVRTPPGIFHFKAGLGGLPYRLADDLDYCPPRPSAWLVRWKVRRSLSDGLRP